MRNEPAAELTEQPASAERRLPGLGVSPGIAICLCSDPRQYGIVASPDDYAGSDVLIVASRRSLAEIENQLGTRFEAIEPTTPVTVMYAGRPAMELPLFIGRRLHR